MEYAYVYADEFFSEQEVRESRELTMAEIRREHGEGVQVTDEYRDTMMPALCDLAPARRRREYSLVATPTQNKHK